MIRVVNIYPNFANRGGAQDVVLQLSEKLNPHSEPIIITNTKLKNIVLEYKERAIFIPFKKNLIFKLNDGNTIFLSHHRKSTTKIMIMKLLWGKKLPLIHIAHNTFHNLKWFCLFPDNVIAVSNAVKENLVEYFKVPEQHVKVIFNGMPDKYKKGNLRGEDNQTIKILLPGRICPVKQQVKIAIFLKGKLDSRIHISFAGVGEDVEKLKQVIANARQFHYVGFLDMASNINSYDYVCLFSKNEGLPLSLIEGCMFGKPLITNDIKAVLDVNEEGKTGFVFRNFDELAKGINDIPDQECEEYKRLSKNARIKYECFFTEEKMISRYEQEIMQIMNRE